MQSIYIFYISHLLFEVILVLMFLYLKKNKDGKGKTHLSLRFRTLSIPSLSWIYNMFYINKNGINIKIVPSNLSEFLNARVLAYWIMDDRSWTGSGIFLHCNSFNLSDVQKLAKLLQENFNLAITIRKKNNYNIIYIHAKSIPIIIKLVKPYMHSTFFYKLGLN
jgi:hypothetical protein